MQKKKLTKKQKRDSSIEKLEKKIAKLNSQTR